MFVIPMVGQSSRFRNAGYALPKYRLPLHGQTVFHQVLRSFAHYFDDDLFLFIVRQDHAARDFVTDEAAALGIARFEIVEIEGDTLGQADTVARGLRLHEGPADEPLYVFNIDTLRPRFRKSDKAIGSQGYLEVFEAEGEHWSFVEPGPGHTVLRTTEKERISNLCSDGLYQFASQALFEQAFEHQVKNQLLTRNEYYIAPAYNALIARGDRILYEKIDRNDVLFCGTPDEYHTLLALPADEFARRVAA